MPPSLVVSQRATVVVIVVAWFVLACSSSEAFNNNNEQTLNRYAHDAHSSVFGEPVFRLEPPSVITFGSSRGATLLCIATGSPRPNITWRQVSSTTTTTTTTSSDASQASSDSAGFAYLSTTSSDFASSGKRAVQNISNLVSVSQNGQALTFAPFTSASAYRADVHLAEYECVASNSLATIHSRVVQVQAGKYYNGVYLHRMSQSCALLLFALASVAVALLVCLVVVVVCCLFLLFSLLGVSSV